MNVAPLEEPASMSQSGQTAGIWTDPATGLVYRRDTISGTWWRCAKGTSQPRAEALLNSAPFKFDTRQSIGAQKGTAPSSPSPTWDTDRLPEANFAAITNVKPKAQQDKSKGITLGTKATHPGKPKAGSMAVGHKRKSAPTSIDVPPKKKGRQLGARGWAKEETSSLLDCVADVLPISRIGWAEVMTRFTHVRRKVGNPRRSQRSLEQRFRRLVNTPKPMGSVEVPAHIERALALRDEITAKSRATVLDDEEPDDPSSHEDDETAEEEQEDLSDVEDDKENEDDIYEAKEPVRFVARHARHARPKGLPPAAPPTVSWRLTAVSLAAVQAAWDDARAARQYHAQELSALRLQLRDREGELRELRMQLNDAQREADNHQRRRDWAEMELRMFQMMSGFMGQGNRSGMAWPHTPQRSRVIRSRASPSQ